MLPLGEALGRRANRTTVTTIDVIAPPYAAAGVGELRVVRAAEAAKEDARRLALTAAYERYERL